MTAFELSVAQALSLLFTATDLNMPDDAEVLGNIIGYRVLHDSDLLTFDDPKQAKKLSDDDQRGVIEFFYQVNAAFFIPKLSKSEQLKQANRKKLGIVEKRALAETYDNVLTECETFTRWGHPGLLEYPWSYFLKVREHFDKWKEITDGG